jgi:hypothetical protein
MGDLTIGTKAVLSQSGSAEAVLSSDLVFPAGHTIKKSFIGSNNQGGSNVSIASTSYIDTGLELAHVTALSSANSYLKFEFYSGMVHIASSSSDFQSQVHMRTVSNSTYTAAEAINDGTFPTYMHVAATGVYWPLHIKNFCGLVTGMGMPATKSSWAAGDTLYFRIFSKRASGNVYIIHNGTYYSLTVTEIQR